MPYRTSPHSSPPSRPVSRPASCHSIHPDELVPATRDEIYELPIPPPLPVERHFEARLVFKPTATSTLRPKRHKYVAPLTPPRKCTCRFCSGIIGITSLLVIAYVLTNTCLYYNTYCDLTRPFTNSTNITNLTRQRPKRDLSAPDLYYPWEQELTLPEFDLSIHMAKPDQHKRARNQFFRQKSLDAELTLPQIGGVETTFVSDDFNASTFPDQLFDEIAPQVMSLTREQPTPLDVHFTAYDCSQPFNILAIRPRVSTNCTYKVNDTTQTNVSMHLMQRVKRRVTYGHRCECISSQLVFFCGAYDHQTFVHDSYIMEPYSLTEDECRQMLSARKFKPPHASREFDLELGLNILKWTAVGKSEYDSWDYGCTGESYWDPDGIERKGMVVHMTWHLTLTQEEMRVNRHNEIYIPSEQFTLSCKYAQEVKYCVTARGTFVWYEPQRMDTCSIYRLRTTSGVIIDDGQRKVYVSTDDTMIRLQLKEARYFPECQGDMYPTHFPDLYLARKTAKRPLFGQLIEPWQMQEHTFASQQDGYLTGLLADQWKAMMQTVLQQICMHQLDNMRRSFQQQITQLQTAQQALTVSLGKDQFATASGEVWYHYQCYEILVQGISADKCYSALPVKIVPTHTSFHLYPERNEQGERPSDPLAPEFLTTTGTTPALPDQIYYIEPYSHRLLRDAEEVPCVQHLPLVYHNHQDRPIAVTPQLQQAYPAEELVHTFEEHSLDLNISDVIYKLSSAGIYTAGTRSAFDDYVQAPNSRRTVGTVLIDQIRSTLPSHGRIRRLFSSNVFPSEIIPSFNPLSLLGKIWSFFSDLFQWLGSIGQIIFGMYIVWRILCFFFGICTRLQAAYQTGNRTGRHPSPGGYMAIALFPSFQHMFNAQRFTPPARRASTEDQNNIYDSVDFPPELKRRKTNNTSRRVTFTENPTDNREECVPLAQGLEIDKSPEAKALAESPFVSKAIATMYNKVAKSTTSLESKGSTPSPTSPSTASIHELLGRLATVEHQQTQQRQSMTNLMSLMNKLSRLEKEQLQLTAAVQVNQTPKVSACTTSSEPTKPINTTNLAIPTAPPPPAPVQEVSSKPAIAPKPTLSPKPGRPNVLPKPILK